MEVILLEKIANLGNLGDKVAVKLVTLAISCCPSAKPLRRLLTT